MNQFRLLHFLLASLSRADGSERAGGRRGVVGTLVRWSSIRCRDAPAEITGGFRDGDERYDALTARRPVAEAVIAQVVAATDGIEVRRGVGVVGLLTGESTTAGVPHVVGVRTDGGEDLHADLVVDASGRRSMLPTWLADIGAAAPVEERADCGFVYYGRHFRSSDGSVPMAFGPLLQEYGTISVLTLPADNGTWGIGVIASANDSAMRALKDVDVWSSAIKSMPLDRTLAGRASRSTRRSR